MQSRNNMNEYELKINSHYHHYHPIVLFLIFYVLYVLSSHPYSFQGLACYHLCTQQWAASSSVSCAEVPFKQVIQVVLVALYFVYVFYELCAIVIRPFLLISGFLYQKLSCPHLYQYYDCQYLLFQALIFQYEREDGANQRSPLKLTSLMILIIILLLQERDLIQVKETFYPLVKYLSY